MSHYSYELYNNRTVNDYFYPRSAWRGDLIYLFRVAALLWLLVSLLPAITLSAFWRTDAIRRMAPPVAVTALLVGVLALWPTVQSLSCALE